MDQLRADGAELRPQADADALRFPFGIRVLPLGDQRLAGVEVEPVELDPLPLLRVLYPGLAEVVEDHRGEVGLPFGHGDGRGTRRSIAGGVGDHPVRAEALDGERPADADDAFVFVRLVVQRLGLGVRASNKVDKRSSCGE